MASNTVRFGHCIRREPHESLEDVIRRARSIVQGTLSISPREPTETEIVHGAEAELGYSHNRRPIYAYLGDLHPKLGIVGLVIDRGWKVEGITRCDSGGLFGGMGGFSAVPARDRASATKELSTPSAFAIADWETEFEKEISQLHADSEDYVRGKPPKIDEMPAGDVRKRCIRRAEARNRLDRRLWTWEARALDPPESSLFVAIVLSVTAWEKYRQLVAQEPSFPLFTLPQISAEDDPLAGQAGWRRPDALFAHLQGDAP